MKRQIKISFDSNTLIALIGLIIALIGGIPGIISIKNDVFKSSIDISYSEDLSFLGQLISDHRDRIGKEVIGFYNIRFAGSGEIPTTIKYIKFYIKVKGKWIEGDRIDIQTNDFKDGKGPCLVIGTTVDTIPIVQWKNFDEFYGNYYVERGKTLPVNVAFMFDLSEKDILSSKEWKFIVTDYLKKQYSTIIDSPKICRLSQKNAVVFDCQLESHNDVQEILKNRDISYNDIQNFITRINKKKLLRE